MAQAPTPGGSVGDTSSLARPGYKGKRRTTDYERQIAHALIRKGHSKSRAIAMARGLLNKAAATGRWGRRGKASGAVRAGAAASIAQRAAFSNSNSGGSLLDLANALDAGDIELSKPRFRHGWIRVDENGNDIKEKNVSSGRAVTKGRARRPGEKVATMSTKAEHDAKRNLARDVRNTVRREVQYGRENVVNKGHVGGGGGGTSAAPVRKKVKAEGIVARAVAEQRRRGRTLKTRSIKRDKAWTRNKR